VLVLLGIVAFSGLKGLGVTTAQYQDLTDRIDPMMVHAATLRGAASAKGRAMFGYLLTQSSQFRDDLETGIQESNDAIAHLKANAPNAEVIAAIEKAEQANAAFTAALLPMFSQSQFSPEQMTELTTKTLPAARNKVVAATDELLAFLTKYSADAQREAELTAAQARTIMGAVAIAAALVGLALGFIIARGIAKPVVAVAAVAERLAKGDLTVEALHARSRDEVGDMANAVNTMVTTLRDVVRNISVSTQSVMSSSEELTASAESSAQAAQESARSVAQVAAGASEQARATEDVNGTVEQLQATIQQIAHGAGKTASEVQQASQSMAQVVRSMESMADAATATADEAGGAAQTARNGADVVERTLTEMEQIRSAVGHSSDTIKKLEQLSAQIGDITGVISGIAGQTNLLALNAAIEAARAGEAGRGFAVVADEIRKLAERAASSTREITDLVRNVQERTAEAVVSMEAGSERVAAGSRLAVEAGQALRHLVTAATRAAEETRNMAQVAAQVKADAIVVVNAFDSVAAVSEENTAATEEMAAGAFEVGKAVERISEVSRENAAASEQVSAAVEELTAASEEVSASAQGLSRVAQDLQEQVARFKL